MLLGALPIPENVPKLKRAKVKLIITLCEPFELDFIYSEKEFRDMGFVNKRYVGLYRSFRLLKSEKNNTSSEKNYLADQPISIC